MVFFEKYLAFFYRLFLKGYDMVCLCNDYDYVK